MRKLKHGCGVVAQNFLLNYSLFKITLNPSKKVEFSLEKQKDMSDDGSVNMTSNRPFHSHTVITQKYGMHFNSFLK